MHIKRNIVLEGKHHRPILADIYLEENSTNLPLALFAHGYKGFKDWGYWDLVAKEFAKNGYCFVKFNFSHNGGTVDQPIDFPDLEAFALNNFTIELDDLDTVINWVSSDEFDFSESVDVKSITLIGHSRGGGIAAIKAAEDSRITKLVTWASVCDFKARFADEEARAFWKNQGVIYMENSRTKQQMPHFYQFYEDFMANEERLTIKRAVQALSIPFLIVHGTEDPTVDLKEAKALHSWNANSKILVIDGADHVFGGQHPWEKLTLPEHMREVVATSIAF
ncbi:alpha/beta hydrolase fold domain-containing protein [Galbibacter sp. BG1]|uniref:alpha/beta hydrolase family protein n=1 Tax=Galbibacter sp. BG1 TaxID=1170699 RepID=UPI0015BC0EBF|nr:alpha/beta fold hydrolase [Galbibacter sp. BG1]QLE00971.1 alpha/beta hydrolase fold domain-containing protein [Galbibacter sp. BG1]